MTTAKKKFTVLALIVIMTLVLCVTACSSNQEENNDITELPTESIPKNAIDISGCRIVYGKEWDTDALNIFDKFIALDSQRGGDVGYYSAVSDDTPEDGKTEIIVGLTNRNQSKTAYERLKNYRDYYVGVIDGKIVISAKSPDMFDDAVKTFLSRVKYSNGKLLYVSEKNEYVKYNDYSYPNITIGNVSVKEFSIVYPQDASTLDKEIANKVFEWIRDNTGKVLTVCADTDKESPYEILVGHTSRKESNMLYESLTDKSEYSFRIIKENAGIKATFAYGSDEAFTALGNYMEKNLLETKTVLNSISGVTFENDIIVSSIPQLRDPFVLLYNGVYYCYGTNWVCYKNTSGKLDGNWESLGCVVETPEDFDHSNFVKWAPEVYNYDGKFYMFTTYASTKADKYVNSNGKEVYCRGVSVFCADSPEGPFKEVSDGIITPTNWCSIDGSLYVDESGQPWMVFVHEWVSTDDKIGRMAIAKMSEDLTELISEPKEIFRADDPKWTNGGQITDGCYVYRLESGELIMLWSNFDKLNGSYVVGIARSDNGKIDGNWLQDEKLLYAKGTAGRNYDGGHGMIFKTISGQLYLSIHSPNYNNSTIKEQPIFIRLREENGTLVWDGDE